MRVFASIAKVYYQELELVSLVGALQTMLDEIAGFLTHSRNLSIAVIRQLKASLRVSALLVREVGGERRRRRHQIQRPWA